MTPTDTQTEQDHRAESQAKSQLEGIRELVAAYRKAQETGEPQDIDAYREPADEDTIRQTIEEDALSVEVRSDWHMPGGDSDNAEYNILLCTGGPACRVIGRLNEYGAPESARIEYQDWFTPWENYHLTDEEERDVLEYACCFYFGE